MRIRYLVTVTALLGKAANAMRFNTAPWLQGHELDDTQLLNAQYVKTSEAINEEAELLAMEEGMPVDEIRTEMLELMDQTDKTWDDYLQVANG